MGELSEHHVVADLLRARASERGDRRFCSMEQDVFTYAEMDRRSDEVAAGFAALGVSKGDRVAILSPNRTEILELLFGLAKVGAIQVPLNAFLKGAFLKHQLKDSNACVLIADSDGFDAAKPLLTELPDLRTVVLLDAADHAVQGAEVVSWAQASSSQDAPPEVEIAASDVMSIVYTSGTTGLPKGCVLPNGYYCRSGLTNANALGFEETDAIYCMLPLFHGGGRMLVLIAGLQKGIPVAFDAAFSARGFFPRAIETEATVVIGMGAMGAALLALPEGENEREHSIHTMMVAPMSPADQKRFQERFGIDPWVEVYGQTECVPVTCTPRRGERDRESCGLPAEDLEVALLDDDGLPVADGEPGEICIRPKRPGAMFSGYWDNAEATVEAFKDLWYHTGDMGKRRESGALQFVDRKKDAMRRRGENVSSMELETAIRTHEAIGDVAVHAVPSPLAEDDIKAVIVLSGERPSEEDLFGFFRDNLPFFAIPRYVEYVDDLPRNAVGRVMKHELRDREMTDAVIDFEELGFRVTKEERRKSSAA
jgi:crotonobetaine/carnitine-CoA ligase